MKIPAFNSDAKNCSYFELFPCPLPPFTNHNTRPSYSIGQYNSCWSNRKHFHTFDLEIIQNKLVSLSIEIEQDLKSNEPFLM